MTIDEPAAMLLRRLPPATLLASILLTGCDTVRFTDRPPDEFLDDSGNFVGTLTLNEPRGSLALVASAPDRHGRRSLSSYGIDRQGRPKGGDGGTPKWFYLYRIGGEHFLCLLGEHAEAPYAIHHVAYDGRVLEVRGIDRSAFEEHWPDPDIAPGRGPNPTVSRAGPERLAHALADDELRDRIFATPVLGIDVRDGVGLDSSGDPLPDTSCSVAMLLPGQPSRGTLLAAHGGACLLAALLAGTVTARAVLRPSPPSRPPDGELLRTGTRIGLTVGPALLVIHTVLTLSLTLWGFWSVLLFAALPAATGRLAVWLTLRNETLLRLLANVRSPRTLLRAAPPALFAVVLLAPGIIATQWVEDWLVRNVASGLEGINVDVPGFAAPRPVVRPPTLDDGLLPYLFGIPQVEVAVWEVEDRTFRLGPPPAARRFAVTALSLFFDATTVLFLVHLASVLAGILLRAAAADEVVPIPYRPVPGNPGPPPPDDHADGFTIAERPAGWVCPEAVQSGRRLEHAAPTPLKSALARTLSGRMFLKEIPAGAEATIAAPANRRLTRVRLADGQVAVSRMRRVVGLVGSRFAGGRASASAAAFSLGHTFLHAVGGPGDVFYELTSRSAEVVTADTAGDRSFAGRSIVCFGAGSEFVLASGQRSATLFFDDWLLELRSGWMVVDLGTSGGGGGTGVGSLFRRLYLPFL